MNRHEAGDSVALLWNHQWRVMALSLCVFFSSTGLGLANNTRVQDVALEPGWNAVFLEVDPVEAAPAAVFAGKPVDVVAAYAAPVGTAQFARNPQVDLLKAYGWAMWFAPERDDAFLSDLNAILGGRGYLVHATTNATFSVTGTEPPVRVRWTPNAFNFVGFGVLAQGAPTFAEFFAGSAAHQPLQVYRLVEGTWRQAANPAAAAMRAGEAFWVYCKGASDFQGPLEVAASAANGVNLSDRKRGEIVFRNNAAHPVTYTIEHIVDANAPVPLSVPVQGVSASDGIQTVYAHLPAAGWTQVFPALEAGQARRLPLMLRSADMAPGVRTSLLKVTSDLGTVSVVPVRATRSGE